MARVKALTDRTIAERFAEIKTEEQLWGEISTETKQLAARILGSALEDELQNVDDENVSITWRGFGPATGDVYGGDATGGCNSCHGAAHTSDFVFEPPVFLRASNPSR